MPDETKQMEPWDQQEGEPNEAYARFLVYRNLGITRSLDAAYSIATKRKKKQTSGQWTEDSAKWGWGERASAWDVAMLAENGRDVVVLFLNSLEAMARKSLDALQTDTVKPKDWDSVLRAITILGNFIPAETVAAIRDYAANDRTPAVGSTGTAGTGTNTAN